MNTINAPMELAIRNRTDRFSPAIDPIDRTPALREAGAHAKAHYQDRQESCLNHAYEYGADPEKIVNWKWE